jgi:hypothetical protein
MCQTICHRLLSGEPRAIEQNQFEDEAREHCSKLLNSGAAQLLPRAQADALVIIAFTIGAVWALDEPDMLEMIKERIDFPREG